MALSVETGGIRLGAPVVPQLSPANALAGLKPLSFTGGLQTPLSFQAPKAWNIGSSNSEAIAAGAASAAQSIMGAYKTKRELERDQKKLEFEEKRLEETKRHNEQVEQAAFDRIEKVTPKGSRGSKDPIDYEESGSGSTDYSSSGNSASNVVSRGTPVRKTAAEAPAEPPEESMVISPESSVGIPSLARIFSPSNLSLGTKVTNVQLGDVVAEPDQKVSLKDAAPPVAVALPKIKINPPQRNLAAIPAPRPVQSSAPSPKEEPTAAIKERRERGEATAAESEASLLASNEQLPKDPSGMPVVDPAAAAAAAKAARTPAPAPALAAAQPPQAAPAYSPPVLRGQEAPNPDLAKDEADQRAVHNSTQLAQDYVSDYNRRFKSLGHTAKIVGEIPNSYSKKTKQPQWRVAFDFDDTVAGKKAEQKIKADAAAASFELSKKRTDNLVEQKLQSRAKSWEKDPNAKIMETRRDAMARFLVAAEKAMNPKLMTETSRPVVDQEMKDLFVTFATGRVPTEGQYHEINTAFRGLPDFIQNKLRYGATGQTLTDKDIITIRDLMLETYNSSAKGINEALKMITEDLQEDFPDLSKRKHPILYPELRMVHELEGKVNAERQAAEALWNSGDKAGSRVVLKKYDALLKELEQARKQGASNISELYGKVPGWHSWRFGGAPENQTTTSE